jgi:hypothetical protein
MDLYRVVKNYDTDVLLILFGPMIIAGFLSTRHGDSVMYSKRQSEHDLKSIILLVALGSLALSGFTLAYAIRLTTNDSGSMTYAMRSWTGF